MAAPAPLFEVSQRVMFAANPQQRGAVTFVHGLNGGHVYYDVRRDDGGEQTVGEHELRAEVVARSAWDLLAQNVFGSHAEFGIATTVHKVRNTANNTISSLRASRTLFKPYQYKPLVKFLASDVQRILVADEVGLGKTIEAGHILLELRGRKRLRNALVVCPKSLQTNWQVELRERFNLELKVYDSARDLAADVRHDVNRAHRSVFGIVTYEKCRNKQFQEALAETGYLFDVLICDEAHRLRNRSTLQHAALARLVQHAEAVAFLTATPIMNGEEDLFNLVRLLDPDRYPNLEVFQNAIAQNRPFIRALRSLNRGEPLGAIAAELHAAEVHSSITIGEEYRFEQSDTVGGLFADDPLYERARKRMVGGEDTPSNRAAIQHDLSELNSLNHLYTRTRKREVATDGKIAQRSPHRLRVDLTPTERALYDEVSERYGGLGVIQHKRMVTSSIVAYHTPKDELAAGRYRADIPDSKFEAFRGVLDEVVGRRGKKAIVFSTFRDTLRYLEVKLAELGIGTETIHGGVDDRAERVARFASDPRVDVLLSSEVGREGLNMQFCDVVVNYDLPWNPMRVEQRIGRVDRIGQTSPVINVYTFTITGTIEERIYERLLEKINVFSEALGDLEEILSEDDSLAKKIEGLEQDLYRTELTEAEQNQRIDEVALAVERQRLDLERIEEGLTDAIVNDAHFRNEIERIVSNRRYLTPEEVRDFVANLFRRALPTLSLAAGEPGRYEVRSTGPDVNALFEFIEANKDDAASNPELEVLYRKFKQRHWGRRSVAVTFDQEAAYAAREDVFVNSYHPLVNAAANYFEREGYHLNQTFQLGLDRRHLGDGFDLAAGDYVLVVYKLRLEKETVHGPRSPEYIRAVLADLNGEEPVLADDDVADHVLGRLQLYAERLPDPVDFDGGVVDVVRRPVAGVIVQEQEALRSDEAIRLESSAWRRRMQQEQYYENQIRRRRELLAQGRGIRDILVREIERLEGELAGVRSRAEAWRVAPSNEVVSVNHLQVF